MSMKAEGLRVVCWHVGVLVAALMLVMAVVLGQWIPTLLTAGLIFVLKRTSAKIPLPRVYRELGLTEDVFMGNSRSTQ
ncbi:hypothetical protein K6V98_07735 [Collinsella sp. AGMB00827]|uniref:Uncharacterized protein n=1 Tax=Collinsella ureilytica TaxID=2869515 RepID=A0ABS7MMA9_9ACTN|nr:hypothetical protein [Collinsella urealyticum]MBY4798235.1 hypothetical protein [Collinsella urealyticum]